MGDFNTVGSLGSEGVSGLGSVAKGVTNYQAYKGQGSYQLGLSKINANLLEMQAADAQQRGSVAASRQLQVGKRVAGAQRTAIAASGVDVNSGTASSIQGGTRTMSEIDALTIENNAHLEAMGYKMDAISTLGQGRMAAIAARNNSVQSLVQGGLGLASAGLKAGAIYDRYSLRVPVEPTDWEKIKANRGPALSDEETEVPAAPEEEP